MKLLIGGSPCTHWSIAQTKNRETEASGIGWELFLNYRIARDKYQPDYFLYENNKSMSSAIRAQITAELGVEPVLINSGTGERTEPPAALRRPGSATRWYIQPSAGRAAGGPWHPASGYFGDEGRFGRQCAGKLEVENGRCNGKLEKQSCAENERPRTQPSSNMTA